MVVMDSGLAAFAAPRNDKALSRDIRHFVVPRIHSTERGR